MADLNVNKNGRTLKFSFEDFLLLPLFFVLIFLSLKICIKKYKRKQKRQQNECASKSCIRCRGTSGYAPSDLLAKLDKFATKRDIRDDSLSRLRSSILEESGKADGSEIASQCPTVLHLLNLSPAEAVHSVCRDPSFVLGTNFDIDKVKEELAEAINKDYLWSYNEVNEGAWKLYYFFNQGIKQGANCDHSPETAKMISNTTHFMRNNSFGNAAFSVLSPGTNIPAHFGSTNTRLRCHITLFKGSSCILYVGDEQVVYEENQVILFDDSYEHSVSHAKGGTDDRIILMLDLWHPEVSKLEQEAIGYLYNKTM